MKSAQPENKYSMIPHILHEDDDIILVNKPAGMLAQDDSTGRPSLAGIVEKYLKNGISPDRALFCAAIHRLDRPVSGVMLFAKNSIAAGRLSSDMKSGNMRKFYCAVTDPCDIPTSGGWKELHQFYTRRRDRAYIVSENDAGAVPVSLRYRYIGTGECSGHVLVKLITGKRHQIRVQLSSVGLPVAGDRFYGSGVTVPDDAISLHAHYLCFSHPVTGKNMTVSAPLPLHMADRLSICPGISDYTDGR